MENKKKLTILETYIILKNIKNFNFFIKNFNILLMLYNIVIRKNNVKFNLFIFKNIEKCNIMLKNIIISIHV